MSDRLFGTDGVPGKAGDYPLDHETESNALDAHISRIRKKLAQAEATVEIRAVRNIGYLIRLKT